MKVTYENGPKFIDDWNSMIQAVADFSEKWELPAPEMVFHPRVHVTMNYVAEPHIILGTLIYAGVKVRFGRFDLATVLREG
jgi:hypothetical protein